MKKQTIGFIALLVGAVIAFAACKCNKNEYRLSSKQLEFLNFRKGTYWIMRDTVTNNIDSLSVIAADTMFNSVANGSRHTCTDDVEYRSYVIAAYRRATGKSIDLSLVFSADAFMKNVFIFQKGNNEPVNDLVNLDFSSQHVNVNGSYYDSVSVNDYRQDSSRHFQVYFHPQNVLLKVGYKQGADQIVWVLDHAHVVR